MVQENSIGAVWSLRDLEARGWTKPLMRKYLSDPNIPVAGKAATLKAGTEQFLVSRVLMIEATSEFECAFERSCKRRGIFWEVQQLRTQEAREILEDIEDLQERIDAVALDIESGQLRFRHVDAWVLGELLGLDWEDTYDWSETFLAHRRDLEDEGYDYPYAENLELLAGKVRDDRYAELEALAESQNETDLPLTPAEVEALKKAYARQSAKSLGPDLSVARTHLTSTNGTELAFEVLIGDGGERSEAQGPYEELQGLFLDESDYVEVH